MNEKEMIRHFLSSIHYQAMKYLAVGDRRFNGFRPAGNIRSPAQILNHINGLLLYLRSLFTAVTDTYPEQLDFEQEVARFCTYIRELDQATEARDITPDRSYPQILQGPLSDIMLHIGELSMQRKWTGSAVDDEENYIFASPS